MPGNFQNLEICAEKISAWRLLNQKIRLGRLDFECETKIAKKFPVGNHRRGERVTTNWAPELAFNPGNILDVIDMPMCQEQKFRLNLKRTRPFASVLRSVEQNPSLRRFK